MAHYINVFGWRPGIKLTGISSESYDDIYDAQEDARQGIGPHSEYRYTLEVNEDGLVCRHVFDVGQLQHEAEQEYELKRRHERSYSGAL